MFAYALAELPKFLNMRKWIIVLLMWTQLALGQQLGFNGAGFFENYDQQTIEWLKDIKAPFTIRVPGGSISKFHDPYNNRNGWGMSKSSVENWYNTVGFDEDGQGKDKWLRKVNEQPDHSYMDDLIALQKTFPNMQVLYVLNVLNSTADANMNAIRYLVDNGVNIVGVEAGNEVYGKYKSFSEYVADFEPIFKMLAKEYPQIKTGLVAGANLQRKELVKWNDALADYKGDYDAVIIHYYYTARELKEAYDMIPEKLQYQPGQYYANLDQAFQVAFKTMMEKKLIEKGLDYAEKQFKGKSIWITEWNTKPSDKLNNTIANAAWQFDQMVSLRNRIEFFLIHNGVSPDKYGMISRRNAKYDSEKTDLVRRTAFWAFQLAQEVENGEMIYPDTKITILKSPKNGVLYYCFANVGDAYTPEIQTSGTQFKTATMHMVSGKYAYSSSGWTGFMNKGSQPGYEVKGITVTDFTGTIPANAFGYIKYTF